MFDKPKVLLVDEEIHIIKSLMKLFDLKEYQVDYATDLNEALNTLSADDYDIVVVDEKIGCMQVLSHIKDQSPQTVRILMTSYKDFERNVAYLNDGSIYNYIVKPWFNPHVKLLIQKAIAFRKENQIKKIVEESILATFKDWQECLNKIEMIAHQSYYNVIDMLCKIIYIKNEKLSNHSVSVASYTEKLAEEFELSKDRRIDLKHASLLHDIGKIAIRDSILQKNGFYIEEYHDIKKHPELGANLVRQLSNLERVALIIEQHHERVDGKGYPMGLHSSQISLEAKIFAVCNTFDMLTAESSYMIGFDSNKALSIIKKDIGSIYDEEVVKKFVHLIKEKD
ncbi:HD domain-containing phosphohydrolase [Alkaliphilus serpentinus]|uniref:Stage 0 sporulation protein A homolog n=1 Tax=Alkaliphilus serpentinus TaxID=1482731 RepID=A0A833HMU3_9FIRM|nr:HD domain-containing phosphohydrolase [Alkaliphilus serpentinus]KAB3528855.1 HD domain-containing protein [Alkaliphilus serpentinus]